MTLLTKNRLYEQYLDQMTHLDFHNWKRTDERRCRLNETYTNRKMNEDNYGQKYDGQRTDGRTHWQTRLNETWSWWSDGRSDGRTDGRTR